MEPVVVYSDAVLKGTKEFKTYPTDLAEISRRDYDGNNYGFPDGIDAIDVDAYETAVSGGQNDCTMDSAVGIADYTNAIRNPRLLLVELRMNYTGQAKNCKTSDMINKDTHTRGMLSNFKIDPKSFFIFSKSVAPHKKSVIEKESKTNSSIKHFKIVSPDQFVLLCKFVKDLPYQPISDIESFNRQASDFLSNNKIESLIKLIDHWLELSDSFFIKYNLNECDAILSAIEPILQSMKTIIPSDSEEATLEYEILCDIFQKHIVRLKKSK